MRLIDADALTTQARSEMDADIGTDIQTLLAKGICERLCKWIDEQPTIEPQRKKGKWIEFDSDDDKYDKIKCDCCKKEFTVDAYHWTDIGFTKDDLNFCPNCGADMRESEGI